MLVITSIREDLEEVTRIFEKAEIPVFSVSETIGHKSQHANYLTENWFGGTDGDTKALFYFSFTDDSKAYQCLSFVQSYNKEKQSSFPVRAFILPVEGNA